VLIVAVFGSNNKALYQASNSTFKHGRVYTELDQTKAYDDTDQQGAHRTGNLYGEPISASGSASAGGGLTSSSSGGGSGSSGSSGMGWKQSSDQKRVDTVRTITQKGTNDPQTQDALDDYYSSYSDPDSINAKQDYDNWNATGGSSSQSLKRSIQLLTTTT
jgi:hypothetical protein